MKKAPKKWFAGGVHARRNPYYWMLGLAMGSSAILFLFLLAMLVARKYTQGLPPLALPWPFYVSTLAILASSATLEQGRRFFSQEKYHLHARRSGYTFLLGSLFVLMQLLGWWQLYQAGVFLRDNASAAFMYILTGLHILHMAMALGLLAWVLADSMHNKTYVDGYLQGLQPAKRTRMVLAHGLWHFAGALWCVLFLSFYAFLQN